MEITLELKRILNSLDNLTILVGDFFNVDKGATYSNAWSLKWVAYEIKDTVYRTTSSSDRGRRLSEVENDTHLKNVITSTKWNKIPVCVRREYISRTYPHIFFQENEEPINILIFGQEKGEELNELHRWMDSQQDFFSREVCSLILKKLGGERWKTVRREDPAYNDFVIDEKWYVEIKTYVSFNNKVSEHVTLTSYEEFLANRNTAEIQANKIAQEVGVPLEVALLVNTSDKYLARDALKLLKSLVGMDFDYETIHELQVCDIEHRKKALHRIMPEWIYTALNVDAMTQLQSKKLAAYLLGKDLKKVTE